MYLQQACLAKNLLHLMVDRKEERQGTGTKCNLQRHIPLVYYSQGEPMFPNSTITRGLSFNRSLLVVVHVQRGMAIYCISLYHDSPNLLLGKRKCSVISIDFNYVQVSVLGREFPDVLCQHKKHSSIYRIDGIQRITVFYLDILKNKLKCGKKKDSGQFL